MANNLEQLREERRRLKVKYWDLFRHIAEVLFRHDPIGINFGDNPDEYEAEVGTILPRLRGCASADDTRRVVFEEFCHWFGSDQAGAEETYQQVANDVWELWQKHLRGTS